MKRKSAVLLCLAIAGCSTGPSSPGEPGEFTLSAYSSGEAATETVYKINTPYAFMTPDGGLRLFYAFQLEDENQITQLVAQERCYPDGSMVVGADGVSQTINLNGKQFVCVDAGTSGASKGGIADLVGDGLVAVSIPAASALLGLSMPSNEGDDISLSGGNQSQDQRQTAKGGRGGAGGEGGNARASGGHGGDAKATGGTLRVYPGHRRSTYKH